MADARSSSAQKNPPLQAPPVQRGEKPNTTLAVVGIVLILGGLGWLIFGVMTEKPDARAEKRAKMKKRGR